jgi:hypothetical protein
MVAAASTAIAQEKGKATVKLLLDNDKVRVTENHYRPGDVGEEDRTQFRVNRTLQGEQLSASTPTAKRKGSS